VAFSGIRDRAGALAAPRPATAFVFAVGLAADRADPFFGVVFFLAAAGRRDEAADVFVVLFFFVAMYRCFFVAPKVGPPPCVSCRRGAPRLPISVCLTLPGRRRTTHTDPARCGAAKGWGACQQLGHLAPGRLTRLQEP
jgi:hypothetical protein